MSVCPSDSDLDRYHAADLDEAQAAEIRAHLDSCEACAKRDEALLARHSELIEHVRGLDGSDDLDKTLEATTQAVPEGSPLDDGQRVAVKRADGIPLQQSEQVGDRVGPYKLLEKLGEGGFGIVYLAEQEEPIRRRVALKIIKPGMDTREVVTRFEAERQALAVMDHPHVAKVLDAGATERGRPYFVMEHVPGVPLTDYCDRHRLNTRQRLELFMQVCDAVQHAHQKGIIHRDIKPSNILVSVQGDQPVPKVIDFGVAKAISHRLAAQTIYTEQGQLIGTPEYMSPEQAEMSGLNVDTRTDIYSLGVLLYEVLVGKLPFGRKLLRQAGLAEIQRIIREVEPSKPSTRFSTLLRSASDDSAIVARNRRVEPRALARELRGDLDWITMKALEKDRTRRYSSASEFAADIHRHLQNEPILASPPSVTYRLGKFVRRHRMGVVASVVVAAALVVATGVSIVFAFSEAEQRRIAEAAKREAVKNLTLAQQREKEAAQARDNLQVVVDFQQSMLSEIDAEQMGRGIIADLRDGIRESLDAETATPETIAAVMGSFDTAVKRVNATDLALKVVDQHVLSRAAETIEHQFANQPLVEAALRQTLGETYTELGLYPQAMLHIQGALALRRQVLGDDHPDTLTSISDMGSLLYLMGKLAEAERYYHEALQGLRRVLGDDHPDTLGTISNIGVLLKSQGKLAEAEPYYREALERSRCVLGHDHPHMLNTINNMGSLLKSQGKLAEAEPYYHEALEGRRRVLGADHPDTLASINSMGALLFSMGKYDEAEPYYHEALEGRRRVLGADHPDTLASINNMGTLLTSMGKLAEAEPYLREALEGRRRVLGDDHPETLTSINNIGFLLQSMAKYEEAEAYYHEALEGHRRVLGDDHPDTLNSINNMGLLLDSMGKPAEAEPYHREALEGRRRLLGADHPSTLNSINNMGALLNSMGKYDEAEPYYREALEGLRRVLGDDHPKTLASINNMGTLLSLMGKLAEAEAYYREALEGYRRVLGDDHPSTLISIYSLGRLLRNLGHLEQAEALGAEAVERARRSLPDGHWYAGVFLCGYGQTLTKLRRHADAETALLEAYEILDTALGAEHERTLGAIESLADLYDAWGKPEQAAEWRAKLPTTQPASAPTEPEPRGRRRAQNEVRTSCQSLSGTRSWNLSRTRNSLIVLAR